MDLWLKIGEEDKSKSQSFFMLCQNRYQVRLVSEFPSRTVQANLQKNRLVVENPDPLSFWIEFFFFVCSSFGSLVAADTILCALGSSFIFLGNYSFSGFEMVDPSIESLIWSLTLECSIVLS